MDREAFLDAVARRAEFESRDQVERAVEEVVRTFTNRLPAEEAEHLAALVPDDLGAVWMDTDREPAAQFGVDEFAERVATRERVDRETARAHVEAVTAAMGAEARERDGDHLDDALDMLQPEYRALFGREE